MEELIKDYGLYAIFFGAMIEGDITLLLAGVLARSGLWGFTFEQVLVTGTAGGFVGDIISYGLGRMFRQSATKLRLYQRAHPRLERITRKMGLFSVFAVKYIYGLRTTSAIFWGVVNFGFFRFAGLTLFSCFFWVLSLSGLGFFFTAGVQEMIGRVKRVELWLLAAVVLVIVVLVIRHYHVAERALEDE